MILEFPLDEVSAKARSGPPADDPADLELPIWAGTIPLALRAGPAEPAPDARATDLPPSVERYLAERG
jgi:hypothetical protein